MPWWHIIDVYTASKYTHAAIVSMLIVLSMLCTAHLWYTTTPVHAEQRVEVPEGAGEWSVIRRTSNAHHDTSIASCGVAWRALHVLSTSTTMTTMTPTIHQVVDLR